MPRDSAMPTVTVVMANYNGARFLEEAVRSVLGQTLADLELIVVDDASGDGSLALLAQLEAKDARLRVLAREACGGPGAARNMALAAARGRWIAVVDSDDLIHPERLEQMVGEAEAARADILIDDLLIFDAEGQAASRTLFKGRLRQEAQWIELDRFIRSNRLYGNETPLGFAKPLLRRKALTDHGLSYDEAVPVGEDYDLVARAMAHGLRLRTTPALGYFYRKHGASISHRLDAWRLEAMARNAQAFRQAHARPDLEAALIQREGSIATAQRYDDLITALKRRDLLTALRTVTSRPEVLTPLAGAFKDRLSRALARSARQPAHKARIVLLSRQRVVGPTNGSSAYLLSICAALRAAGHRLEFLSPTPATFGRWPVMRLGAQMDIFETVRIRGGLRLGRFIVAKDPRILWRAGLTGLELVMAKARLARRGWVKPAPYAISAPATRDDQLYVARHARGAQALLCDYAFATPLAPYALSPKAKRLVVMHDLFSSRGEQFAQVGAQDSVAALTIDRELALLAQADFILAIQQEEAKVVSAGLPDRQVMVAPMAVEPIAAPSPGDGRSVLFVGSNTAPNVVGLAWLFDKVWPQVLTKAPHARLVVAGNVSRGAPPAPQGVDMLGPVPDLEALYASAAVVVSPLITGSGLKIKVVEALARGKALVATSVSLQGVEDVLQDAVRRSDDPQVFADHIVALLADEAARLELGGAALRAAHAHFSAKACYGDLVRLLEPAP